MTNKQINELLSKGNIGSTQLVKNYSRNIIKSYSEALKEIKSMIAAMYEKYGNDVQYSDMVKFNRLVSLEKQIIDELNSMNKTVTNSITAAIKDQFEYSFYYTGFALETSLGVRLGFGLLNPDVIKASVLNPLDHIKWTTRQKTHVKTLVGQIRGEITQGLIQGRGYAVVAKNVQKRSEITAGKSIKIIQTETHRVQNAGFLKGFEKVENAADDLDISVNKVWIATLDDKTRSDHQYMDGKLADEEGLFHFPNGKGTTLGPGLSGIAEEDINCRCTTGVNIEGFEPQLRKDNISKQLIGMIEFSEWKRLRNIN